MPVNSTHPDYDAALPLWKRCRDAYAGSDAIKEAAEDYLPKLDDQEVKEYEAYQNRALWYGATARTVQGLTGAIFRKDPLTDVPEDLLPQLDDITLDGVTLQGVAKGILEDILIVGRAGLLVDMSAEDVPAIDRRPYWVPYSAEEIINWKTRRIAGKTVLSLVVLAESAEVDGEDAFESISETRYRVLKLDESNLYTVEIWKEVTIQQLGQGHTTELQLAETFNPTRKGQRLDFIPFVFFNVNTTTPAIEKPPLLDLVDVNLWHYMFSADYGHGLHYVGLPTPWATGFDPANELKIGSGTAWISQNENGQVGMLEVAGDFGALTRALEGAEAKMAALGARLLEQQKTGVEAAESIRLRQSGEHGSLQSIATTESQGLSKALAWHAEWAGVSSDGVRTQLNKDFFDTEMDPQMLQSLFATWQAGGMSFETFYYNLQKGEIARPGVEADEEKSLIDAGAPDITVAPGGAVQ